MTKQLKFLSSINSKDLFKQYGSPIYIYNENQLRLNYQNLKTNLEQFFDKFQINYLVKANNNPSIINVLRQEGAFMTCTSPAEIHLSKVAGVKNTHINYAGIYQNERELIFGLKNSEIINLDNSSLLNPLLKYGTPKILSFTLDLSKNELNKFGINLKQAILGYKTAQKTEIKNYSIKLNLTNNKSLQKQIEDFCTTIIKIYQETNITFKYINFSNILKNLNQDETYNILQSINKNWESQQLNQIFSNPTLIIESDYTLLSNSGLIIAKIDSIKEKNTTTFLGTGFGTNLFSQSQKNKVPQIIIQDKTETATKQKYRIVGKITDNNDIIAPNYSLPEAKVGDTLVFLDTAAYTYSTSSHADSRPKCAEVLINQNIEYLIRKPEKAKDLHLNVIIPKHLKS